MDSHQYGSDSDIVDFYSLTLQYKVGDAIYRHRYKGFKVSYEVGETLEIIYNPEDPTKITNPSTSFVEPLIMIIVCGVFLFATVLFWFLGI